jgi:hypothetical protein
MKRTETQRKQIKDYLLAGNTITALDALRLFNSFRLSAHIFVLKNDYGMDIETEMVYEDKKRYAKYYLKKEE